MDANQKLLQFMDSVTRGTDAEIAKAEQEAQQDAAEILRAAQAECSAQAERQIAEKKAKITAKYQKRMSQAGYRGKISLLSRRQMLLIRLFQDLRQKLNDFTASGEYVPWLKKLLALQTPENGAVILLREADLPLAEQLKADLPDSCTFRADAAIRIGGLSVLSADGRRCMNHTLDEAYAAKFRNFYRDHKFDGGDEPCSSL